MYILDRVVPTAPTKLMPLVLLFAVIILLKIADCEPVVRLIPPVATVLLVTVANENTLLLEAAVVVTLIPAPALLFAIICVKMLPLALSKLTPGP